MNPRPDQYRHRLRRRRIEAGLSQTALAARAGVTKSHLCQVEKGNAGFSPENLGRLADALGCTIADLMPSDDADARKTA